MKIPGGFDPRLESLRGIAALAVVITHSLAIFRIDGSPAFWALPLSEHTIRMFPLHLIIALFNAGSAVVLFFVLSGYVLTLSLQRAVSAGLTAYAVRRSFRLLPPMWASVILMWATLSLIPIQDMQPYSEWFQNIYKPLHVTDISSNLFLWSFNANPVTWTMYVELVGSALIPVSLWVSTRYGASSCYILLAAFAVITALNYHYLTFAYLVCFQTGVIIAIHPPQISARPWTLALAGYALFVIDELVIGPSAWSIWTNTIGAGLIIVAVINGYAEGFLTHQFMRNVGRVSYSVYLLQLPAIYVSGIIIGHFFEPGLLATAIAVPIIIPTILLIANIGYALFESPSIQLGRELGRRLNLVRDANIQANQ